MNFKNLLIFFFSITLSFGQNLILEGLPQLNEKESKRLFKSNKGFSKILIKKSSTFKLDLRKCSFINNKLVKAVYRASGPENYKSYNKRLDYMDLNKILDDLLIFLNNNLFSVNYKSPNYNDVIAFFENYETILIDANNNKINLKIVPIKHDINYSLFIEISTKN